MKIRRKDDHATIVDVMPHDYANFPWKDLYRRFYSCVDWEPVPEEAWEEVEYCIHDNAQQIALENIAHNPIKLPSFCRWVQVDCYEIQDLYDFLCDIEFHHAKDKELFLEKLKANKVQRLKIERRKT